MRHCLMQISLLFLYALIIEGKRIDIGLNAEVNKRNLFVQSATSAISAIAIVEMRFNFFSFRPCEN